jgi:hypothetical protein
MASLGVRARRIRVILSWDARRRIAVEIDLLKTFGLFHRPSVYQEVHPRDIRFAKRCFRFFVVVAWSRLQICGDWFVLVTDSPSLAATRKQERRCRLALEVQTLHCKYKTDKHQGCRWINSGRWKWVVPKDPDPWSRGVQRRGRKEQDSNATPRAGKPAGCADEMTTMLLRSCLLEPPLTLNTRVVSSLSDGRFDLGFAGGTAAYAARFSRTRPAT